MASPSSRLKSATVAAATAAGIVSTNTTRTPTKKEFNINFTGDVMLGRLIDQLFPVHVHNPDDQSHAQSFIARHAQQLQNYSPASPWGSTLPLFTDDSDLNIINLETSVTTHRDPWPGKAFNYRMHPANAPAILGAAKIDFASLANNHTLDFGPEGLIETAWTLKNGDGDGARIGIGGAGENTLEAISPAILELPRSISQRGVKQGGRPVALSAENMKERAGKHLVHVYAASDHPRMWSAVPTFHLIDYSEKSKAHLKRVIEKYSFPSPVTAEQNSSESSGSSPKPSDVSNEPQQQPSLKIFSIHWGPNYSWHPAEEIRSMAHFLIFDCGIDIVHGHSSHHIQGVECPAPGKLIIYGCGDFVDDYAVHGDYRNDLGAVYRVVVREEDREESGNARRRVMPVRLEIFPTRIHLFQAQLLDSEKDADHKWVVGRIKDLTDALMGTGHGRSIYKKSIVRPKLGPRGQIMVDLV